MKNNGSRNNTNSKKIPWIPNIGRKIRKEFKKVNKDIIVSHLARTLKASYAKTNRSYCLIVIVDCTS